MRKLGGSASAAVIVTGAAHGTGPVPPGLHVETAEFYVVDFRVNTDGTALIRSNWMRSILSTITSFAAN
jgi:hypothetical protein